ncbi:MAG: ECF RNA polymerase sigma factor SigW [candidate division WS6 bacterium OLB20]|uniref:ECF RNA polymerase sigma factor SigW n=1 Tax=candidate division WS6 bacterium OLB20 TaxID=1617426 RepID=A0A136LXY5_9BACT|nr:MAG: ECF RNA polymerase sigma factor SigW [candidate division WS6 bacterium OLB20]
MDKETLLKAKQGDKESLAAIFDQYADRLYRYVYIRIRDQVRSEDLVSVIFIKILENIDRLDISKNFEAWMFTIARNALIDSLRKNRFVTATEMIDIARDEVDHEENADTEILIDEVRIYLEDLKGLEREVIELTYFGGLNDKEISKIIKKPVGNIRVIRFRAVKKLQQLLQ